MAQTTGAQTTGSTGVNVTPAGTVPQLDIKWLGAIGVLWFVLVALASLDSSRDLAVALAWLIAIGALTWTADPNGANVLARLKG